MDEHQWIKEFPGAVTVCDQNGIILEMNDQSANMFQERGGKLQGLSLWDCHPDPARTKLTLLMEQRKSNVYTIEKKGLKKLVYQTPWYKGGQYSGFLEIVLDLPEVIPHFIRD